jgi:hypothetical protein
MHDGIGGMLEMHDQDMGGDFKKSMLAWQRPKAELRKFLNAVLQLKINLIFCFRAKEKLKIQQGKEPLPLGWMPVADDQIFYEMTLSCLLYPNSRGVPSWQPNEMGEKAIIKLPGQFESLFREKKPLDEATGEALARWAAGGTTAASAAASSPATPPTAASKSAVVSTPAAGSKVSPAALEMLSAQLQANGLTTKEARKDWFQKTTGKALNEATEADIAQAIEQAEAEAA